MPCRDYEDDYGRGNSYEITRYKEQNDRLARIACRAMTALEKASPEDKVFQNPEQAEWWLAHKVADAKAQAEKKAKAKAAKEKRELDQKKKELIEKMSEEERKILGF